MPEKLEQCVLRLMDDPDFKPKDGEDRKSAAYAVCTAQIKKSDVQKEKAKEKQEAQEEQLWQTQQNEKVLG